MTNERLELDEPTLLRTISLPWLVLYGLGTTVGAGIYALTGIVAGRAGMNAPLAFMLASGIAFFSALSFAELGARFPRAGGEAVYVREGFGRVGLSVVVGLMVVASGLISSATLSVGFAGYIAEFVAIPRLAGIVLIVLAIGGVAAWGVRESLWVAGLVTLLELGGLVAVIVYGSPHLADLPERAPEIFALGPGAASAVGGAAVLAFYAFLGFEDMVNVAEEVRDVQRTLPAAIVITITVTTLLYFVLSAVSVIAVPPAELAASGAPLALVFERCGGSPRVLGGIAIFALVNGALIQVIMASRILFGLAGHGAVPVAFGRINARTRTPLLATAVAAGVVALLAAVFPLETLAEMTSFVTLAVFSLVNAALVRVKRRHSRPPVGFVVPTWVPIIGFAATATLLALGLGNRLLVLWG